MIDVKANVKGQYLDTRCVFGCIEEESQVHLLNCTAIIQHCTELYNDQIVEYEDMYGSTEKQILFVKLYQNILKSRTELLRSL